MQDTLIAGDSLNFLRSTPGYSAADGWVLKYRLVPRTVGGSAIDITAIAEGDDHRVQVAAGITAGWSADTYGWAAWVELGAEKYTVQTGQIVIKADPRTVAAGADSRTQAEKALGDARAAMAAWTPTRRRYRIGDREMEFSTSADIVKLISYWEVQVKRERRAQALAEGRPDPAKTYVRISRA